MGEVRSDWRSAGFWARGDACSAQFERLRNEVHLWRFSLNQSRDQIPALELTLSDDERERAKRFRFSEGRARFTVARGMLRRIFAGYLDTDPAAIRFSTGPQGKPFLDASMEEPRVQFNLSHSHEMALCAVTRGRQVGVDIECITEKTPIRDLAERFFSRAEVAELAALPDDLQREAFFHCWTRKEAYIKARGEGLTVSLDQFDVSVNPDEPARLLRTRVDMDEPGRWVLASLQPAPGYAGALAVEGRGWRLAQWDWRW